LAAAWKESYKYLALQLWGAGFLLFYIAFLRLFHFTSTPLLSNNLVKIIGLTLLTCGFFGISWKKNSIYLISLSLTLFAATILLSNATSIILIGQVLIATFSVYFYLKNKHNTFYIFSVLLISISHCLWAMGNPLVSGSLKLTDNTGLNLIFLLIYTIIFSSTIWMSRSGEDNLVQRISHAVLNGFIYFIIYSIISVLQKNHGFLLHQALFFFVYFGLATSFWFREKQNYSTVVYSLLAFAALSIGIIGSTGIPLVYIYLIWQSLLVAAAAIWFKSKNIIVANFLIFMLVFVAYSAAVGFHGIINISFGLVALISARILNWQRHRLTLKTELMRNTYLAVALFSLPIVLLKSLPHQWVGLSWIGLTIAYYLFSVILENYKYRWMGHLNLLATIIFVFTYGSEWMGPDQRILTFIALGVVLILMSLLFAKFRRKSTLPAVNSR
jgi:hypothetical protein